jgi:hypothetical protein
MSGTSTDGLTMDDIMDRCNLRRSQIEKALRFLAAEDDAPVRKVNLMMMSMSSGNSNIVAAKTCERHSSVNELLTCGILYQPKKLISTVLVYRTVKLANFS